MELVQRLATPRHVRYLPGASDGGQAVYSMVQVKTLRLSATVPEMKTLSLEQVEQLILATTNARDRFLLALLAVTGLRIGEALGLRREDLHLLASSSGLGCSVAGPHVHVRRRMNDNGAFAKARAPRSIPVPTELVQLYATISTNATRSAQRSTPTWCSSTSTVRRWVWGCVTATPMRCSYGFQPRSGFQPNRTCFAIPRPRSGWKTAQHETQCSDC